MVISSVEIEWSTQLPNKRVMSLRAKALLSRFDDPIDVVNRLNSWINQRLDEQDAAASDTETQIRQHVEAIETLSKRFIKEPTK